MKLLVPLWKNERKYHFLYANLSSYLTYPKTPSVRDVTCSFGAVHANGNGTQISCLSMLTILQKIFGPSWILYFLKATSLTLRW
jgi:hypothetical protein